MPLRGFKQAALRCHTPKGFRILLKHLRDIIPLVFSFATWGHPSRSSLRYFINDGFPLELIRWYLATGALWSSPIFAEWLNRSTDAFVWADAAARHRDRIDPELLRRFHEAGVQWMLIGGAASAAKDFFVAFAICMETESAARKYITQFNEVLPALVQASQQSFPDRLLTTREQKILERRILGEIVKQIADAEGICPRTVSAHLAQVKKKLYTDDLLNAVAIALRTGMALSPRSQV